MSVNFTPGLEPYKETGSFRFWCQKVLPLVYDDSLSYYELLCKVVNYLNDVISNVDGLKVDIDKLLKAYNELQDYVNNYFDNLDVQEEINKKLDQMVEDGTLAWIIDNQIFKGVMNKVRFMTPNDEQRANYVQESLRNIASYMSVNNFSPCVVGSIVQNPTRMIYKYAQGEGYMGVMGVGRFVYDDVENIGGIDYNIAYMDCSTFLSLILKCIPYNLSAYAYAFSTPNPTQDELMKRSIEDQSMNKPYTIDWFNNVATANSSFIMNQSGCSLQYVSKNDNGVISLDETVIDQLETGDILYFGRSADYNAGDYLGVYHCGYYLKTLEELNQYGLQYNQTYKAIDNYDGSKGYVVHCTSTRTGKLDYGEVVCISTLEKLIEFMPNGSRWHTIMTCKPWSNTLNDNKALRRTLLMDRRGDFTLFNTITGADVSGMEYEADTGMLKPLSIGVRGISLNENDDLNNYLRNGVWIVPNRTVKESIVNGPPTTLFYDLIGIGFGYEGQTGTQIALCQSVVEPKIFIRTTVAANQVSPWTEVSNNTQKDFHHFGVLAGNSSANIDVTFDVPFSTRPVVVATLNMVHNDSNGGKVSCAVRDVTTTGFNLVVYNSSEYSTNIGVFWIAE